MNFLIRLAFYCIGLFIMTFGVCMTIKADLGAGAWDALNVALTDHLGLSIGRWVMIDGAILVFINALLVKRKPDLLSFLTIIVIGFMVDFWMYMIFESWQIQPFIIKLITLISGILIIGMGISCYLQAKYPQSPIDNFMLALKERFHISIGMAKTIGELTAFIPALLLKGPIGIGTIIITFAIGPSIQLFFPFFDKFMRNLQAKYMKLT
ncbi:YczE/YyaS/YitT family protein [Neobacillus thermocopriae]|uniref:YczE/YyaS/YitT family protein n=1 Tax=Neobacillus thermocopriae TaxID=1215031 RepID=UPI002E1DA9BE|nr:YitT family protein [Neobacillus thermocopriae]MED3715299.1 YitT family protein [Neobacillus thermocopriae]